MSDAFPPWDKVRNFTLVYMISYIPTSIAIGSSQSNLPLFLREELRRFWSIRQESYRDET